MHNLQELSEELSIDEIVELYVRARLCQAQRNLKENGQPITAQNLWSAALHLHNETVIGGEQDDMIEGMINKFAEEYARD